MTTRQDSADARIPVIVGVGEIVDRLGALPGKEPIELMAAAVERANLDAGGILLGACDSIDIVNEVSWPYQDPVGLLCDRLKIRPPRTAYGVVGGQTPVQFIHDAAIRISRGECGVAIVCGAEAEYTVKRPGSSDVRLWGERDANSSPVRGANFQQPVAKALNAATPANVYPFYENATLSSWGQSPREALAESADLWSAFSDVAASRSTAWLRQHHSAAEILATSEANRLIAWPYRKLSVANPNVNQGAATILTSLERARSSGIPEDRLVYVAGGAAADEPADLLARDRYDHSPAMEAVLAGARKFARPGSGAFDCVELYSCFPCVPKMARRILDLPRGAPLTVTGGLTFFGAPLNNYMGHATVAMVETLRRHPETCGLLYGQGGYVTKHHALVLTRALPIDRLDQGYLVQPAADRLRAAVPRYQADFAGQANIETFTVLFARDGSASCGIVIARSPDGQQRTMARVSPENAAAIARLTDPDRSPIGLPGHLQPGPDGIPVWEFA